MQNKFYNDFDISRQLETKRTNDYRTAFQIDRDRVIHSSEFRRLQGKTQVFLPGEYDFYRTRLTHSIEVAQIGRSICTYLLKTENSLLQDDYYIDPDLVESSCLAHDLGHPPFGHMGERTLHELLKTYGGFEGNAQTLRLLTETFYRYEKGKRGMNPTRSFLDSVLKYKSLYGQLNNPINHFIYDYQKTYLDFVFNNRPFPDELKDHVTLTNFRSIECQIMDWADDTAYAINDIVDSISGGFMSIARLSQWGDDNNANLKDSHKKYLTEVIEWIRTGKFKQKFGSQIGDFIRACKLVESDNFMSDLTNRYKYNLYIDSEYVDKANFYKRISIELVFRSPQLHQMEFKGDYMIRNMFNLFKDNYLKSTTCTKLLNDFNDKIIRLEQDETNKVRLICDQLAGMTDSFAMKTYRRLFDPEYGSISDLI